MFVFQKIFISCFFFNVVTRKCKITYLACIYDSLFLSVGYSWARISYSNWDPQTHDINTHPGSLLEMQTLLLSQSYRIRIFILTKFPVNSSSQWSLRLTGSECIRAWVSWLRGEGFLTAVRTLVSSICHSDLRFLGCVQTVTVTELLWHPVHDFMKEINGEDVTQVAEDLLHGRYFTQSSLGQQNLSVADFDLLFFLDCPAWW